MEVESILTKEFGIPLNRSCYIALVTVSTKFFNLKKAFYYVNQMKKQRLNLNASIYTSLIRACANPKHSAPNLQLAESLFQEMQAMKVMPTKYTLNAYAHVLCMGNQYEKCFKLLEFMISRKIVPDIITMNVMIKAACHSNDMDHARRIFNRLPALEIIPTTITYNTLIHGYSHVNDGITPAMQLLDQMQTEHQLSPTAITINSLLNICAKGSHEEIALKLFDSYFTSQQLQVNEISFNTMIHLYTRLGQLSQALAWKTKMSQYGFIPVRGTYDVLIKGYAQQGLHEDMVCCWREMLSLHIQPTMHLIELFIYALSTCQDITEHQMDLYKDAIIETLEHVRHTLKPHIVEAAIQQFGHDVTFANSIAIHAPPLSKTSSEHTETRLSAKNTLN